jgi:hypothetical protein
LGQNKFKFKNFLIGLKLFEALGRVRLQHKEPLKLCKPSKKQTIKPFFELIRLSKLDTVSFGGRSWGRKGINIRPWTY